MGVLIPETWHPLRLPVALSVGTAICLLRKLYTSVWCGAGVAGLVTEDHHSTRGRSLFVIFGSETQTDMFWNQNFGTKLLQEKHAAFA